MRGNPCPVYKGVRMLYKSGYGFPSDIYFDTDRAKRLHYNKWFFVATRADLPKPRDTFKFDLLGESYFLVHGRSGTLSAYVNRCAHQSARLVHEDMGKCGARIICPNHQWVFDAQSGALIHGAAMPKGFETSAEGKEIYLDKIAVSEVDGLIFACLNPDAAREDLDVIAKLIGPYTAAFDLGGSNYKTAYHHRETVPASWLSVMINNRECNHCARNHKQLLKLFDPSSFNGTMTPDYNRLLTQAQARWTAKGLEWKEQAFTVSDQCRIARYPLAKGFKSITFDGRLASKKLIGPHIDSGADEGTLSIWLNPNAWIHMTSDHIATNWVLPIDATHSELYTSWIVHKDAVEGKDYHKAHMTDVWRHTNAEDVALCKSMTQGTQSEYYRPGPFSPAETFCTQFCDWYMRYSQD